MVENLKFPVLVLNKPAVISIYRNLDELTTCTKVALKNGHFNKLKLYDCEGLCYEVKEAKKIGSVGKFWGYNIFLNQKIRVALTFNSDVQKVSLDDFKEKLLKTINRDRYFWSSGGDLPEIKTMILDIKSFEYLIQRMREFVYNEK